MRRLELKFPPLLIVAAFAAAMVALARAFPAASIALPLRVPAAIALAVLGGVIAIAGVIAFRAHRTTVNPMRPESAATVVIGGVYRFSRNPMYLGLLLALAGLALYVSNALAMLLLPAFVACMNRVQIEPEERALAARFGEQYAAYRARVRRWV